MRTITLQATKRHPSRAIGEIYESEPKAAMRDLYQNFARGYRHQVPKPEPIRPPLKAKRRYKRRDLQAE